MRLHLACIDFPDYEKHYTPEWIQVENQTFSGVRVPVDNHQYGKCVFENCNFVYSGGPFGFSECELTGGCMLSLTGAARRSAEFWQAFEEYLRLITPY